MAFAFRWDYCGLMLAKDDGSLVAINSGLLQSGYLWSEAWRAKDEHAAAYVPHARCWK
jgi:hypothetical protein